MLDVRVSIFAAQMMKSQLFANFVLPAQVGLYGQMSTAVASNKMISGVILRMRNRVTRLELFVIDGARIFYETADSKKTGRDSVKEKFL